MVRLGWSEVQIREQKINEMRIFITDLFLTTAKQFVVIQKDFQKFRKSYRKKVRIRSREIENEFSKVSRRLRSINDQIKKTEIRMKDVFYLSNQVIFKDGLIGKFKEVLNELKDVHLMIKFHARVLVDCHETLLQLKKLVSSQIIGFHC